MLLNDFQGLLKRNSRTYKDLWEHCDVLTVSRDIPRKVGAVIRVDDEVLLSVEKTARDFHNVTVLILQHAQEVSEHQTELPCQQDSACQ